MVPDDIATHRRTLPSGPPFPAPVRPPAAAAAPVCRLLDPVQLHPAFHAFRLCPFAAKTQTGKSAVLCVDQSTHKFNIVRSVCRSGNWMA